eukprot:932243-Rhodomonas_salina.2
MIFQLAAVRLALFASTLPSPHWLTPQGTGKGGRGFQVLWGWEGNIGETNRGVRGGAQGSSSQGFHIDAVLVWGLEPRVEGKT